MSEAVIYPGGLAPALHTHDFRAFGFEPGRADAVGVLSDPRLSGTEVGAGLNQHLLEHLRRIHEFGCLV